MAARKGSNYARGLRIFVKRRRALREARPFAIATAALADHFVFSNGVLCYSVKADFVNGETGSLQSRTVCLRLLDVRSSGGQELDIDARGLLHQAGLEAADSKPYKIIPVHYAEGILSCRCTLPEESPAAGWLLVVDARGGGELLTTRQLESTTRLFVRNDGHHLYYGTRHEESATHTFRRWALWGFRIEGREWLKRKIVLADFVGSDVGGTVAFEIFDGYLYGVANQTVQEMEEVSRESHYYAFRFPLDNPTLESTEETGREHLSTLRRCHNEEGPIDDRWNTLGLERDEASGHLVIVEVRREWRPGTNHAQRFCFRRRLQFWQGSAAGQLGPEPGQTPVAVSTASLPGPGHRESSSNDLGPAPARPPPLPDDAAQADNPDGAQEDPGVLEFQHHGDGSGGDGEITFNQCALRAYDSSCRAFLDLFSDPLENYGSGHDSFPQSRRLWLRVTAARPTASGDGGGENRDEKLSSGIIRRNIRGNNVRFWPPNQGDESSARAVAQLQDALRPSGHWGSIETAFQDGTIVYAARDLEKRKEGRKRLKTVVIVSFDPSVHIKGLVPWGGSGCGRHVAPTSPSPGVRSPSAEALQLPRDATHLRRAPPSEADGTRTACSQAGSPTSWAQRLQAMHVDLLENHGLFIGFDLTA